MQQSKTVINNPSIFSKSYLNNLYDVYKNNKCQYPKGSFLGSTNNFKTSEDKNLIGVFFDKIYEEIREVKNE